ncbi:MAG: DUF4911 domain-containing protein [Thermodesulfobacteriota bacterium]
MPLIFLKLRNPSDTVYFQSIVGTYSHIAWTRTEDAEGGIIKVIPTEDTLSEAMIVLRNLRLEVEFDEIDYA